MPTCPANPPQSAILHPACAGAWGLTVFALDCVNCVNLVPMRDAAPGPGANQGLKTKCSKTKRPKTKWGPALLPAPTVAAAGTLAFQRLSSPRPSAVPCPSVPVLANGPFFRTMHLRSASPSGPSRVAGSSFPALHSGLRRPQFLTAWAWQSLAPVPHSPRCRASCCCVRVSFAHPRATLPPVRPCGLAFGRYLPRGEKGPSARPGVLPLAWLLLGAAPGLATIGLAASALLRDAISASGAGPSGLPSTPSRARLSTLKVVSKQTFQSGPIRRFPLFDQCLAALLSGFVSLSTRQMLRLRGESHKQQNGKLSTGSPRTGGQLRKLRKPLCFSFVTIRCGLSSRAAPTISAGGH